jgi:hypothetical protein
LSGRYKDRGIIGIDEDLHEYPVRFRKIIR